MKQFVINKERACKRIKSVKNYIYTLLYVISKNLFNVYNGMTIYYGKEFKLSPIGYDFWTEIILCGLSFKIINRTCRF